MLVYVEMGWWEGQRLWGGEPLTFDSILYIWRILRTWIGVRNQDPRSLIWGLKGLGDLHRCRVLDVGFGDLEARFWVRDVWSRVWGLIMGYVRNVCMCERVGVSVFLFLCVFCFSIFLSHSTHCYFVQLFGLLPFRLHLGGLVLLFCAIISFHTHSCVHRFAYINFNFNLA